MANPDTVVEALVTLLEDTGGTVEQYPNTAVEAVMLVDDHLTGPDGLVDYVADWLDDHPEATTTVEDGAVTTDKLASGAVTTGKLADGAVTDAKLAATGVKADVARLRGNILRGSASGATVTLADAYAVPPLSVTVDGKSVQDGTPTPSDPVEIESVESVAVAIAGASAIDSSMLEAGTINGSGDAVSENRVRVKNADRIAVTAGQSVIALGTCSKSYMEAYFHCYSDGTDTRVGSGSGWLAAGQSFVVPDTVTNLRVEFRAHNNTTVTVSDFTGLAVYVGTTTAIPLDGHVLRSLPDGTHDELLVDESGHVTLVQRVGSIVFDDTLTWSLSANGYFETAQLSPAAVDLATQWVVVNGFIEGYTRQNKFYVTNSASGIEDTACWFGNNIRVRDSSYETATAFKAGVDGMELVYQLATPQTHDLGTVTLPTLPAPDVTAWADTDPDTTMALGYERDQTIAYDMLALAIADV